MEPPVARLQHRAPTTVGPRGLPRASPFYCRPFGAVRGNGLYRSLKHCKYMGFGTLGTACGSAPAPRTQPLLGPRRLPRASPFYCRPFGAVRAGTFFYRSLPHSKYMGLGTLGTACGSAPAPRTPPLLGPRGLPRASPFYCRPFGAVRCKSVFTDHCPIANTWGSVHLVPPVARPQHPAPPPLLGPRVFLGPAPSTAGHLVQFGGSRFLPIIAP